MSASPAMIANQQAIVDHLTDQVNRFQSRRSLKAQALVAATQEDKKAERNMVARKEALTSAEMALKALQDLPDFQQ